ncbi:MAG: hypothetical protein GEV03_26295 [Streptosporangiales bacterium]|nr:hypothetical protein [Streptosporangiales bacterium]
MGPAAEVAVETPQEFPVLVVGAGPVGLTTALALASYGVRCALVETEPRHVCDGSRSIVVQKHTMELAERIGAGRTLADEGVTWSTARTYFRTTELFHVKLGETAPGRYPPFVNIPQRRVEEILLAEVERQPLVTLLWSHTVEDLDQDDAGVTVQVATPEGPSRLRVPYLVGCDGGHSAVRDLVGVGFPGYTHGDRFLIADIRADLPFPDERRFFFDPPWNPGRQVLVHPQPDKVWRIDWQVPSDVDVEEERRTGRLDRRIRQVIGDVDYEIAWLSQYTFAQRLAERFRVGRVFLAGDAAHLMSVFGARGMNSGMQDAVNLSWKLWLATSVLAPDALLDTYEAERRPAASENLRVTEATMRFMVPPSRVGWLLRNAILRLSLPVPRLRRYVNSGKLSQPYVYADSPIVAAPAPDAGPAVGAAAQVGAVAPDATGMGPNGERVRMLDLVGANFTALYLARDPVDADRFGKEAAEHRPEVPTRVVTVVPSGEPGPDRLVDDHGEFAAAFESVPGRLYLIRPDTHIAARLDDATGQVLPLLVGQATARNAAAAGAPH